MCIQGRQCNLQNISTADFFFLTRSEYRVRNQSRTLMEKERREKKVSFICPWARRPWSRWWDCHNKTMFATGNMSHPWPFCAPHLHFLHLSRGSRSSRAGRRSLTSPVTDAPAAVLNPTCDLPVRVGLGTGPPCPPSGEVLFWSQLHVGHQTELRERENVSGRDDLFLFVCRFLCSAVEYIHDMHYGGVVVAEEWILILSSFTLFPKSNSHLL